MSPVLPTVDPDRPIPAELYHEILSVMPVACVDVIVPSHQGILLVRRKNEPAKDQWWLPGGRILKGETMAQCALRKAKHETGLICAVERIVHVEETLFETGPGGVAVHTVNICMLLQMLQTGDPVIDRDHSDARWINSLSEVPLHGYVARCIAASGRL